MSHSGNVMSFLLLVIAQTATFQIRHVHEEREAECDVRYDPIRGSVNRLWSAHAASTTT